MKPKIFFVALFFLIWGGSLLSFTRGGSHSVINPKPDAVEYLAGAQQLALEGQYSLKIGELTLPPRYSPGWPLILSLGLKLGIDPLDAWKITSFFGSLFVAQLALLAALILRQSRPSKPYFEASAMILAGFILTQSPLVRHSATRVASDLPAAALGCGALLIFLTAVSRRTDWYLGLASLSGFLLGLTTAVRPLEGVLFGIVLVAVFSVHSLRWESRSRILLALATTLGFLGCATWVSSILGSSGWGPWPWTHYEFWIPNRYGEISQTFHLKFLTETTRTYPILGLGQALHPVELSNPGALAAMLSGLFPSSLDPWCFGLIWPLLFSLAGLWSLVHFRRGPSPTLKTFGAIGLGWLLLRFFAYGTYFFPAGRFHLSFVGTLFVLGLAYWMTLVRDGRRLTKTIGASAIFAALVGTFVVMSTPEVPEPKDRQALHLRAHQRWLEVYVSTPASQPLPFDPVVIQAFGRMDEATVESMRGRRLPRTVHTFRLMVSPANRLADDRVTERSAEWEARRFLAEHRARRGGRENP